MNDRRAFRPPVMGGSSILVVFAVLCLTVFAMLSLATAQTDARLSQASADGVSAYYAADTKAEEILARLLAGELPDGVTVQENRYTYRCPISDTQALEVEIRLTGPGDYTILRWQAVSTADWTPDNSIAVWDGEEGDLWN